MEYMDYLDLGLKLKFEYDIFPIFSFTRTIQTISNVIEHKKKLFFSG